MLLREYELDGGTFQFREGREPPDAVPVEEKERPAPANKARKAPMNKGGARARSKSGGVSGAKRATKPAE